MPPHLRLTLLAAACALLAGCGKAAPSMADAERGRHLVAQYQCGRCHTVPGVEAARGRVAVTLQSFGARSYIAGRVPNSDEALRRWIADPQSLVPGTAMPDLGVSDQDARDIAAYLRGLK